MFEIKCFRNGRTKCGSILFDGDKRFSKYDRVPVSQRVNGCNQSEIRHKLGSKRFVSDEDGILLTRNVPIYIL